MRYDPGMGRITRWMISALAVVLVTGACTLKNEQPAADAGTAAPPDVAGPPADALKTASGRATKVLRVGLGRDRPGPHSQVLVNYSGWTTDGKLFDSSLTTGAPAQFGVDQVIPGWTEGLQLMVPGEKRRMWIPGNLAYDKIDMPGAPKGMLVFDVELLEIR